MSTHLSEDELILHYYGEIDRADQARVASHLASCDDCRQAGEQLRRVMMLVDAAAPVEAPDGFERIAWARLEPQLDAEAIGAHDRIGVQSALNRWIQRWIWQGALAGGVAALLVVAFYAGRITSTDPHTVPGAAVAEAANAEPGRVLRAEVGAHLDRTQMVLVELANAEGDHAGVLAGEQQRASDLVAANRIIRQSAQQAGDTQIVDILEDLERVLLEIANAPADASSNELTDLQSRITAEDLLFRLRVIASEMRQRNQLDRGTGGQSPRKMPTS